MNGEKIYEREHAYIMGIFDRLRRKKGKQLKDQEQEKNRAACIEEIVKAKGISEEEAKKELRNTRKMLGVPYRVYLEYGFAAMTPEEQCQKCRKLISMASFRGKKNQIRDEAIFRASETNGWTYSEAKSDLEIAKNKYGIKTIEYLIDMFYKVPEEARDEYAERILREREYADERKEQKNAADEEKTKAYVDRVAEASGKCREEVIEMMQRAKEMTGATKEQYTIYRFWELSEEEQLTYFTKGVSRMLIDKYCGPHIGTKRMMNHKNLFYEDLRDYLGRRYLNTALMNWDEFRDMFMNEEKIVYKTSTGGGGKGVAIYSCSGDENELREIFDSVREKPFGLVETYLKQHPDMQRFSEKSVNTIRIVVIRTNDPADNIEIGKVHFVYAGLRMSTINSYLDNLHSGGALAIIDVDSGTMVTGAANHLNQIYEEHPVTGVQILGAKVPYFKEAKDLVEKVMTENDIEGYYGWDVAITTDGPVLVEGNNNPGADGLQIPYVPYKKGMRYIFDDYLK